MKSSWFPGHVDAIYVQLKTNFPLPCKLDAFELFELDKAPSSLEDAEANTEVVEYLKAAVNWLEANGYIMCMEKDGRVNAYTLSEKWLKIGTSPFNGVNFY